MPRTRIIHWTRPLPTSPGPTAVTCALRSCTEFVFQLVVVCSGTRQVASSCDMFHQTCLTTRRIWATLLQMFQSNFTYTLVHGTSLLTRQHPASCPTSQQPHKHKTMDMLSHREEFIAYITGSMTQDACSPKQVHAGPQANCITVLIERETIRPRRQCGNVSRKYLPLSGGGAGHGWYESLSLET